MGCSKSTRTGTHWQPFFVGWKNNNSPIYVALRYKDYTKAVRYLVTLGYTFGRYVTGSDLISTTRT